MTVRVFIDGAHGTTGLEIRERLAGRDGISFIDLDDASRKDIASRRNALNDADIAILCLPDDAAREAVAMIDSDTRVIDASSAYRIDPDWTYGFPELRAGQREAIMQARLVSNPGCYPTGFLALIAPLVATGLIDSALPLTVNAVSGYSGGGKALIERFEQDSSIAFRAYGLSLDHKHVPEMQFHAGLVHPPLFEPAVIPAYRGMLVDVPLNLPGSAPSIAEIREVYQAHYAGQKLINLVDTTDNELLIRSDAPASDRLDIHIFGSSDGNQVRLIARIDNLCKGASGAAVQNFNLMIGADEYEGLCL